jgi:hypothetical protein
MSVEVSVYSEAKPVSGSELITAARKKRLELRLLIPFKCLALETETLQAPLKKQDLMIYAWPKRDTETTVVLDQALAKGITSQILSVQDKFGWFDFRCEKYDYARFWKKHVDEQPGFEASVSNEALNAMQAAKTRYVFRCALRPKQNAGYLDKVAKLVRDLTGGYMGE